MSGARPRILVIKLSALGDFVLAFPAFARIRAVHANAEITLLTTPPFAALARASPYFDVVESDGRPTSVAGWLALVARLRRRRHARVYDLQGNDRTNLLFQALRPAPPAWSGAAWGCALPHRNPARGRMHTLERQAEQLRDAGIWAEAPIAPASAAPPDVVWMVARTAPLASLAADGASPLALLVPGASPARPSKRWPADRFGQIARRLIAEGWRVAVIGAAAETPLARSIQAQAPGALDLTGKTDLFDLAAVGARARLAIANDTGPAHLIAAAGAPCVVLFSADSDPALCAPRGRVNILAAPDLAELGVETVWRAAQSRLDCGGAGDHIAG